MKIISAIGGSGSSFVIRALEKAQFGRGQQGRRLYRLKLRFEKTPSVLCPFYPLIQILGIYKPSLLIMMRPDAFWTDRRYNPACLYNPESQTFSEDLIRQREYLISTRFLRSAGLRFRRKSISVASLKSLVESYIEVLSDFEKASRLETVLVSCHWGEYGIFKELGISTIYLIRDPLNSLISHSKATRHRKDYLRRGLTDINSREWIDAYLKGPHHYWINHASSALNHPNAKIVRYHRLAEDWLHIEGLPNIGDQFFCKKNNLDEILSGESINYIVDQTSRLCEQLELPIPASSGGSAL